MRSTKDVHLQPTVLAPRRVTRMTEKIGCFAAAILLSVLSILPGCGSLFSTCHNCPPPPPPDNSGSWSGSIQVPSLSSGGNIDMAFVQSGTTINSTRLQITSLIGPPDCGSTGTMTGSITGSNIVMTITETPAMSSIYWGPSHRAP